MAQEEQLMRVGEVGVCKGVQQENTRWNKCWTIEEWNSNAMEWNEIDYYGMEWNDWLVWNEINYYGMEWNEMRLTIYHGMEWIEGHRTWIVMDNNG